jgi:hypothetical protein
VVDFTVRIYLQDQSIVIDCIAATPDPAVIVTAIAAETTITTSTLIADLISTLAHLAACSI